MPPITSPAAASIPFINLFASMASSVENKGLAEPTYKASFLDIVDAQKFQWKQAIIFFLKDQGKRLTKALF